MAIEIACQNVTTSPKFCDLFLRASYALNSSSENLWTRMLLLFKLSTFEQTAVVLSTDEQLNFLAS
jgi:hypothetical protein